MIPTALSGSSTSGLLDGTLPLRPFHPDGFVGTMQADGQEVRVAALACDETRVVALSLVGFDTSIGGYSPGCGVRPPCPSRLLIAGRRSGPGRSTSSAVESA